MKLMVGLPGGTNFIIERCLDSQEMTVSPEPEQNASLPDWCLLSCHQCSHCPLNVDEVSHCPAAVALHRTIEAFADVFSHTKVQFAYEREFLSYKREMSAQEALAAAVFMLISGSGCPVLQVDNWAWKYFSPAFDLESVLFRRMVINLVLKHLNDKCGETLHTKRSPVEIVANTYVYLKQRLEEEPSIERDALHNALVYLHTFTYYLRDDDSEFDYTRLVQEIKKAAE